MKIAEQTATWRRERRVLRRVSRAAWRLEQAGRKRSWRWARAAANSQLVVPQIGPQKSFHKAHTELNSGIVPAARSRSVTDRCQPLVLPGC